MNQQIPQPEKKGLSKGCTVALIVGGILVVIVAAAIILVVLKGEKWAYKMAANSERTWLMTTPVDGIDTTAVNRVADAFIAKVDAGQFESEQMLPFGEFVREQATDSKIDSAEAVDFVNAMIECFPELADLYNPMLDTAPIEMPDEGQE
jgi:hypothetical protein